MVALSNRTPRSQRLLKNLTASRARSVLESSPLFRGRSQLIQITENDGRLVLEGRLPSYYLKQILQTVLLILLASNRSTIGSLSIGRTRNDD